MSRIYRADLIRDVGDWQRDTIRLLILRPVSGGGEALMPDGTWQFVAEGEMLEGAGLALPADVIGDIADAIARFQGNASHGATEAKVLREWLKAERDRVDALIGSKIVER